MKKSLEERAYDIAGIRAIVGLGNPGQKYYKTRHNIGFQVVDTLAQRFYASWSSSDATEYTQIRYSLERDEHTNNVVIMLIKPMTYMNESGKIVSFLRKKGINPDQVIVVYDELEMSFGKMMVRFNGSARGHNGVRSIMSVMGKDFWRLRFGIGRPADRSEVGNYVLAPFSLDEARDLDLLIEKAADLIMNT